MHPLTYDDEQLPAVSETSRFLPVDQFWFIPNMNPAETRFADNDQLDNEIFIDNKSSFWPWRKLILMAIIGGYVMKTFLSSEQNRIAGFYIGDISYFLYKIIKHLFVTMFFWLILH